MSLRVGSSEKVFKMNVKGNGQGINMNIGDLALKPLNDTAIQQVIKSTGMAASKVIQSGGDIISAPAVWLKDIQQNWFGYMVLVAIIMISIVFLYCTVCFCVNHKKDNGSNGHLVELAKIISHKAGICQQPLPLPAPHPTTSPSTLSV